MGGGKLILKGLLPIPPPINREKIVKTLQNFINKHTTDLENVQRY
jgi:hypothetical protein